MPSTPAVPLFAFTRFLARCMFSLASTCSSEPYPASVASCRAHSVLSLITWREASSRFATVRSAGVDIGCSTSPIEMTFNSDSRSAFRPVQANTTTSADFSFRIHRRPFRHEARSPQVRTHYVTAQFADLCHFALNTRTSRFLSIGSQFHSTLHLHRRSPYRNCASLRSLWSARGGTCTHRSAPMLGAPQKNAAKKAAFFKKHIEPMD